MHVCCAWGPARSEMQRASFSLAWQGERGRVVVWRLPNKLLKQLRWTNASRRHECANGTTQSRTNMGNDTNARSCFSVPAEQRDAVRQSGGDERQLTASHHVVHCYSVAVGREQKHAPSSSRQERLAPRQQLMRLALGISKLHLLRCRSCAWPAPGPMHMGPPGDCMRETKGGS